MVDTSILTPSEKAEFVEWLKEKRDRFQNLLDSVLGQSDPILKGNGDSPQKPPEVNGDGRGQNVVTIMQNSGRWLANSDIRSLYKRQFGDEIESRFLIRFLRRNEGSLVKRQGSARYTKWKTIEKK